VRSDVEVAVVGGGIMGLATAHALAALGRDALVLEQFRLGHGRGSSHGATRIFRLAYPQPEWVRLAQEALTGWRKLEEETATDLVSLVGLLELVRDLAESSQDALASCGVDCSVVGSKEVEERFGLWVPQDFVALLQPDAGVVYAERAREAFGSRARVQEEVRVVRLAAEATGVRLETDAGLVRAKAAVVTAGAWAGPLLETAGISLAVVPTRETVAYFSLATEEALPAVAEFQTDARRHAFYALPDPRYGLKAGLNGSGGMTDPDVEERPDPHIVDQIVDWIAQRFPVTGPEPVHVETCLYTNTSDESFVLERNGPIVVGSACSGHAFKFAPVVGGRLAGLTIEALRRA
jgi:sarcosine oxidase